MVLALTACSLYGRSFLLKPVKHFSLLAQLKFALCFETWHSVGHLGDWKAKTWSLLMAKSSLALCVSLSLGSRLSSSSSSLLGVNFKRKFERKLPHPLGLGGNKLACSSLTPFSARTPVNHGNQPKQGEYLWNWLRCRIQACLSDTVILT